MALVGREFKLFSIFMLWLFFSLLSSVNGSKQNNNKWYDQFKYPFIKKASEFDSASSSFESKGRRNDDGGFDYIVVGGGTAGCPLAATLSRNFTVLVVERGGVPFSNANVSFLRNFHIGLADTSPLSASQPFVSTDGVINSRARVLGGGTAINAGFYTRASPSYVKKMGWDAKIVNESFAWVEKQIVHEPVVAPWQQAFKDSLLDIGVSPFNGFTYDHLYGTKVGGTIFDRFGRRHTAAELLSSADPRRLTVLLHATVHNIIFDTTVKPHKAVGVVFKDEHGKQHEAVINGRAESEVIVTCGAIGTPQMLMLSGVGPREELKRMNITSVLHNEFVGKGMVDNPMNSIFVPSHKPVAQSLIQTVGITKLGVYIEASSGFGQSQDSIHCHHGIMSAEIGQLSTVPPKQRTRERIEEYVRNKKDIPQEAFQGGFILEKIARPLSSGHLNLLTTNPEDNPSVTFNYFSHPSDLRKCVAGVRAAVKVAQSKHFGDFSQCDERTAERLLNMSVKANVNLVPRHTNDSKSLEQFCRDTVITIWHYHGGAHVGKVVDKQYKVMGLARLRVVDGSIFNDSPGTNPQATVMMMGRYMGVKILRERLGRAAGI